ncbi:hypothetical protein E2C01_006886 [Portunus trituberculatus]|uniref:Uncharacterized protein n=1 Tax=Portunus trituberculatus TaxID=210409 RepID=A0A5B7CWL6_PORTR|nr:hypothetical protein [Portunus trituberculatus]
MEADALKPEDSFEEGVPPGSCDAANTSPQGRLQDTPLTAPNLIKHNELQSKSSKHVISIISDITFYHETNLSQILNTPWKLTCIQAIPPRAEAAM